MGSHIRLVTLIAFCFLISSTLAEKYWYFFWLTEPDDNLVVDYPQGQPKTNQDFLSMLKSDSAKVQPSRSSSIGEKGFTWWVAAELDENVVKQKYSGLGIVRASWYYEQPASQVSHLVHADLESGFPTASPDPIKRRTRSARRADSDPPPQSDAPRHLRFISMPQEANNDLDGVTQYKYDSSAGMGVRVYVIDSGVNLDSSEWGGERDLPDFIFTGAWSQRSRTDIDEEAGHGTCMADLAVGKVNGVAKNAEITAVQVDFVSHDFIHAMIQELEVDAVARILDDIVSRGLLEKAVISMSITVDVEPDSARHKAFIDVYARIWRILDLRGVSLVVTTPNGRKCVDEYPCAFGDPKNANYIPNLITVGSGLLSDGRYAEKEENRDDWTTIYAPGDDPGNKGQPGQILCADRKGDKNAQNQQGASHATAMVAGLMAYFKGLGVANKDAINLLNWFKYHRAANGPAMIWNGYRD